MAFATTTDSATIGTTEYSIVADSTTLPTDTTDWVVQPVIWGHNLANGDIYRIRYYESDGTTKRMCGEWFVGHVQSVPGAPMPPILLMVGSDITVTKIAGTDRSIGWSFNRVT